MFQFILLKTDLPAAAISGYRVLIGNIFHFVACFYPSQIVNILAKHVGVLWC